MKATNQLIYLLAILYSLASCKKEIVEVVPESITHTLHSEQMGKNYTLHVLYPEGYDTSQTYHTLILLDANDYFVEMTKELPSNFQHQFVLVGVSYNNFNERQQDFTFPAMPEVANSGHADRYIQFLGDELLPYLQYNLNIKTSETTLMGHSLSGYLATYLLLQQDYTHPFDNIIAASPSLWWSDGYIFGLEQEFAQNQPSLNSKFFITMGDLEGAMMNTHFNAFTKKLNARNYHSSTYQAKRYKNTSHRNSPIKSFVDGIRFIQ